MVSNTSIGLNCHRRRKNRPTKNSKMTYLNSSSEDVTCGKCCNKRETKSKPKCTKCKCNLKVEDVRCERSPEIIGLYKWQDYRNNSKENRNSKVAKNDKKHEKKFEKKESVDEMGDACKSEDVLRCVDYCSSSDSSIPFEDPCPDLYRRFLGPTLDESLLVLYDVVCTMMSKLELFDWTIPQLSSDTTHPNIQKRKRKIDLEASLSPSSNS